MPDVDTILTRADCLHRLAPRHYGLGMSSSIRTTDQSDGLYGRCVVSITALFDTTFTLMTQRLQLASASQLRGPLGPLTTWSTLVCCQDRHSRRGTVDYDRGGLS